MPGDPVPTTNRKRPKREEDMISGSTHSSVRVRWGFRHHLSQPFILHGSKALRMGLGNDHIETSDSAGGKIQIS